MPAVEPRRLRLAGPLYNLQLHQAITDQQRVRDRGLDRLLVPAADDEAVDHRGHVLDLGFVEGGLVRDVDDLVVHDQQAAALLADLGDHHVQVFAV